MITVYHMRGARGVRILWTCEEIGLSYEVKLVDFAGKPAEYAGLNPSMTIPVMVDDGVVISESIAACQYLAARHGPTPLVVGPDEPGFGDYLQFMMLGEAGLAAPMSAVIGTRLLKDTDPQPGPVEAFIMDGFMRRMAQVERQLADGREFLVGGRLTLADISVSFPIGVVTGVLRRPDLIPPAVQAYRRNLYSRDAFRRAHAHGAAPKDSGAKE
jgi:glutathione S-transferase